MAEYIRKGEVVLALLEKGLNYDAIVEAINALPAADVAPVKHGKWTEGKREHAYGKYYYRYCPVCNYERNDCDSLQDTPYCPNCGAQMEDATDV